MNLRLSAFFALQRAIGSRADLRYRDFLEMERWSADRLQEWREKKIRTLLNHAARTIPFYREHGPGPGSRLTAFPIMTKDALHGNYKAMMAPELAGEYETGDKPRGYSWLEVTSGGTTGVPTTVIHDREFRDMDRAARLYEQHLCGFPFGAPHYRLWGAMEDIHRTRASLSKRIMAALANETLLNAFMMEDARIEDYITRFRSIPRKHMIAYVDALEQIVRYAEARGIALPSFDAIMVTGGTLTEDAERTFREAFGARIHNKYGSRDCGELACSCERGSMHVLSPNVHIELLDDRDQPVNPGEAGRVIVTFLGNYAFPIIRFDIGDIAIAGSGKTCGCGRPFPTIERVTARTVDMVRSTSGGFVTPVYIRHTVGVVHGQRKYRRYQFVQKDRTVYELSIQPETGTDQAQLDRTLPGIRRDLLEVLGQDADLTIRFVPRIEETAGGKFRHVINRYHPES